MHRVYQDHHIPPDEVFNKPKKFRLFMYASDDLAYEESKKAEKGGNN